MIDWGMKIPLRSHFHKHKNNAMLHWVTTVCMIIFKATLLKNKQLKQSHRWRFYRTAKCTTQVLSFIFMLVPVCARSDQSDVQKSDWTSSNQTLSSGGPTIGPVGPASANNQAEWLHGSLPAAHCAEPLKSVWMHVCVCVCVRVCVCSFTNTVTQ